NPWRCPFGEWFFIQTHFIEKASAFVFLHLVVAEAQRGHAECLRAFVVNNPGYSVFHVAGAVWHGH
ncbi:MAG TPA: hypothetical protein VFC78_01610, partial [Tepidisphaeraceae bacterium]|nr:hypothetical protein [Tepidisphaeraceae bacterium]